MQSTQNKFPSTVSNSNRPESYFEKESMKSIFYTALFFFSTVIVPHSGWLGGFLVASEINEYKTITKYDFLWNRIKISRLGESLSQSYDIWIKDITNPKIELVWKIIPVWGIFWLIMGICAAILVVIPPVLYLTNNPQKKLPFPKIGLIFGLVGTMIEFILFFLLLLFENQNAFLTLEQPGQPLDIGVNLILLGFFIIGWISLIAGSVIANKEYPSRVEAQIPREQVVKEEPKKKKVKK